jgi:hypothetical protein
MVGTYTTGTIGVPSAAVEDEEKAEVPCDTTEDAADEL